MDPKQGLNLIWQLWLHRHFFTQNTTKRQILVMGRQEIQASTFKPYTVCPRSLGQTAHRSEEIDKSGKQKNTYWKSDKCISIQKNGSRKIIIKFAVKHKMIYKFTKTTYHAKIVIVKDIYQKARHMFCIL